MLEGRAALLGVGGAEGVLSLGARGMRLLLLGVGRGEDRVVSSNSRCSGKLRKELLLLLYSRWRFCGLAFVDGREGREGGRGRRGLMISASCLGCALVLLD